MCQTSARAVAKERGGGAGGAGGGGGGGGRGENAVADESQRPVTAHPHSLSARTRQASVSGGM